MDTTDNEATDGIAEDVITGDPAEDTEPEPTDDSAETFSADYVRKLRDENAKLRVRAQGADEARARVPELEQQLHVELVRATGRLADPTDLVFNPEHLESAESLTAALDSLLEAKPHLRSRTPKGDAGQGYRQSEPEPVGWLSILKTV